MPWPNERRFAVGQRVAIPDRGPGVVVEVLERTRDCDGNVRTPYRVRLDSGREWIAHPDRMRAVREAVLV